VFHWQELDLRGLSALVQVLLPAGPPLPWLCFNQTEQPWVISHETRTVRPAPRAGLKPDRQPSSSGFDTRTARPTPREYAKFTQTLSYEGRRVSQKNAPSIGGSFFRDRPRRLLGLKAWLYTRTLGSGAGWAGGSGLELVHFVLQGPDAAGGLAGQVVGVFGGPADLFGPGGHLGHAVVQFAG
jgi:hypothetical protein